MKTNRSHQLTCYLILTGLAVCFSAAMLSAEDMRVDFTLPFETQWAGTVLPAGEYSVMLDSFPHGRVMSLQQGAEYISLLVPVNMETLRTPAKSQLLIMREGNTATVHILYIADLGTAFHFPVPKRYEVHTRLITRADEPVFIQRIPVTISGK